VCPHQYQSLTDHPHHFVYYNEAAHIYMQINELQLRITTTEQECYCALNFERQFIKFMKFSELMPDRFICVEVVQLLIHIPKTTYLGDRDSCNANTVQELLLA